MSTSNATVSPLRRLVRAMLADLDIRAKLIAAFLLVTGIAVLVIFFFTDRLLRVELTENVGGSLHSIAITKAQNLGDFFAKQADILEVMTLVVDRAELTARRAQYEANSTQLDVAFSLRQEQSRWESYPDEHVKVQSILDHPIAEQLRDFRNTFPENKKVIVTDVRGAVIAATDRPEKFYYGEDEWWVSAYEEGRGRLDIGYQLLENELSNDGSLSSVRITIAQPIYGEGVAIGVLQTQFEVLESQDIIDILRVEEGEAGTFVDLFLPEGKLLLFDSPEWSSMDVPGGLRGSIESLQTSRNPNKFTEVEYANGVQSLISEASIKTTDPRALVDVQNLQWSIVVHEDSDTALESVQSTRLTTALIGSITVFVASALAIIVAQLFSRPITHLTQVVQQVANNNLSVRARVSSNDEIGLLADNFNTMTDKLSRTLLELEDANTAMTRHADELKISNQVAQEITSILDPDRLLTEVVHLIRDQFQYYFVGVWLVDQAKQSIQLRAFSTHGVSRGPSPVGDFRPLTENTVTVQAATTGRLRIINDYVANPDSSFAAPFNQKTKSRLAVPLSVATKVIGVLDIRSDKTDAFVDERQQLVFRILSNQIAIALRNARLYGAEQERRRLAEALEKSGRALTSKLDVQHVSTLILDQLYEVVNFERGSVLLQNEDNLWALAHRGYPEEVNINDLIIPIQSNHEDIFMRVVNTRTYVIVDDVTKEAGWQQFPNLPVNNSWLGTPLMNKGNVIGMLSLTRHGTAQFDENEGRLVQTFAGQAAIALENAMLYQEINDLNVQLDRKVQQRTIELEQANTSLKRMDQAKSDFIHVTSHELRTPLTVVKGYTQLLKTLLPKESLSSTGEMMDGILEGTQRMYEVVNSMLDVTKIDHETLKLHKETVLIRDVIESVHRSFRTAFEERQLTAELVNLDSLPPIQADREQLIKVFYQIIMNAIKYTPDGGRVIIEGSYCEPSGQSAYVELMIRDSGIGIDPAQLDAIFEKFYQTGEVSLHSTGRTKFKGGGPGLGLAIAKGIVLAHEGEIWAESEAYDEDVLPGSKFFVQLPLDA